MTVWERVLAELQALRGEVRELHEKIGGAPAAVAPASSPAVTPDPARPDAPQVPQPMVTPGTPSNPVRQGAP